MGAYTTTGRGHRIKATRPVLFLVLALVAVNPVACKPELPDADSPGARLYRQRCGNCHRLFAPGSMTRATWELNLRMHLAGTRRGGRVPLTKKEEELLLDYLVKHSGKGF